MAICWVKQHFTITISIIGIDMANGMFNSVVCVGSCL